VFASAVEVS